MWRWPIRVLPALCVTVLAAAAAAGCSLSVAGAPVKAHGGPPPGAVDISQLDSGNYPTDPSPHLGTAGAPLEGALIEARRMANNVVGPWEVDPSLTTPSPLRAMVLKNAAAVGLIEPAPVAVAVQAHNFINGFSSDRQGQSQQRLMNAVLRFADPFAAAAAAADMAGNAASVQPSDTQPVAKVAIPAHPDALASTDSHDGSIQYIATVLSFTAHGPYVLCQTAQAGDIDTATALISRTLDIQGPLIDQFAPTDPTKFADLVRDPTGLLARTVRYPTWPEPEGSVPANPKVGVYEPHAALHLQDDPPSAAAALSTAGVQAMSYYQTIVYQARDPADAAQLATDLANSALQLQPSAQPADGVGFMPTSQCLQSDGGESSGHQLRYYCFAPVGTFTIEARAAQLKSAHEQIAAQYKMLATY